MRIHLRYCFSSCSVPGVAGWLEEAGCGFPTISTCNKTELLNNITVLNVAWNLIKEIKILRAKANSSVIPVWLGWWRLGWQDPPVDEWEAAAQLLNQILLPPKKGQLSTSKQTNKQSIRNKCVQLYRSSSIWSFAYWSEPAVPPPGYAPFRDDPALSKAATLESVMPSGPVYLCPSWL